MTKRSRRFLVAGNWKMHMTCPEAEALVSELVDAYGRSTDIDILVCPPFTALACVTKARGESNILVGAQNMHAEASGAYTGCISAAMLRDLFVTHVILGHSECRTLLKETDGEINAKVLAALKSNLRPIFCVGESLEEREAGETLSVIARQVSEGLKGAEGAQAEQLVIAYEPVWAIGTGKSATPEMAEEVHAAIRKLLADQLGAGQAERIRILYGGSVKPENAEALFTQPNIDGALVGGASLTAGAFSKIIEAALAFV